jgi:hypothetical protein
MNGFATPVVLFVFNRVDKLRRLLAVLCRVRPAVLLVVADGPRAGHADDAARCKAVRALLERIAWPCVVHRHYAEVNLGCDRRIASGIDWVFGTVGEAIFLEDDLLPDPSFFPWCAAMLARYRDAPTVLQVAGRNELGQWIGAGGDHHLIHRVGTLAWATWRRAWQAAGQVALPGDLGAIGGQVARGRLDPLVAEHFAMMHGIAAHGALHSWDNRWALRRALLGGMSVVPPINLVSHVGFDAEATHGRFAGDIRALQQVGTVPAVEAGFRAAPDLRLDRWALLLDLMATWRNLAMLDRLARAPALVTDERLRHQLAPFAARTEALAALGHLRRFATDPAALDPLITLLRRDAVAA